MLTAKRLTHLLAPSHTVCMSVVWFGLSIMLLRIDHIAHPTHLGVQMIVDKFTSI